MRERDPVHKTKRQREIKRERCGELNIVCIIITMADVAVYETRQWIKVIDNE